MLILTREDILKVFTMKDAIEADKKPSSCTARARPSFRSA